MGETPVATLIQILLALVAGGVINAIVAAVANRKNIQAATINTSTQAQSTVISDLQSENKRLSDKFSSLETSFSALEDENAEQSAEIRSLSHQVWILTNWSTRIYESALSDSEKTLYGPPLGYTGAGRQRGDD